jgi:hypothetical protein
LIQQTKNGGSQPSRVATKYLQITAEIAALDLCRRLQSVRFRGHALHARRYSPQYSAAEQYGRKFYIMYDATGWTNMQSEMKADWTNKMKAMRSSPAYATQARRLHRGFGLPRCHQLIQEQGLLRHRRRTDALASRHRGLASGYSNVYNINPQDQADAHGMDYQPRVIPGDLQSGHRLHDA